MKVIFMGSPDFAVPALEALLEHHEVALVVTQPDKPAGRGKKLKPPPVKVVAERAGIPVAQPRSARKPEFAEQLRAIGADIAVVVAYGKILPQPVLDAPRLGCINIHGSLLPAYRGAAPIQWAVIDGLAETGVTIMQLDEGMDTGPMLLDRRVTIEPTDTAGTMHDKLAPVGAQAMLEALAGLEAGTLETRPQDHERSSHAPMLSKEDGRVDWRLDADAVRNRVRGVDPWPGAFAMLDGERIKLFAAAPSEGSGAPGEIVAADGDAIHVACGAGAVALGELQAPGKRRMSAAAFASGRPDLVGKRFELPPDPGDGDGHGG